MLASLNTDDPAVGVDIIHEYTVAAPAAGLSREQIRQAQINGLTGVPRRTGKAALIQRVAKG